jgi:alpha-amylase
MIQLRRQQFAALGMIVVLLAGCLPGVTATATATATMTSVPSATATQAPPTFTPTPVSKLVNGTNSLPWWNDTVFYEIFVRSFADSNGDGIGDFNGITAKLDYLEELGIRGLWLTPINPSPSYHGYDVTDYYNTNPAFGTLDDFKRLVSEAHKRGIRVILDLVINHTSDQHPWFTQALDPASPYHDWYIWSDTDPGYLGPMNEKVWYPASNGMFYYGIFTAQMPDLNYKNAQVTQEMEKVTKFWLDLGIDGYRLDAAQYLIEEGKTQANTQSTLDWYKGYKTFYKGINPQAMVVGEVAATSYSAVSYIKQGGMDLTFDFDLARAWVSSVLNGDANNLMGATLFENGIFKNDQLATFLTNHDQNRVMSSLLGVTDKAKEAATILLTSPGVPFIYYGEEIGQTGVKPDQQIRTPMQWTAGSQAGFTTGTPWEAVNSEYSQVNVEAESKDPASLYNLYKALIQARNQHEALRVGSLVKVTTGSPNVYAMLRTTDKEAVLVLMNMGKDALSDYQLGFTGTNLKGSYTLQALIGEGSFSAMKVDDQGGLSGYQPVASLAGYGNLVLLLKAGN